MESIAEVENSLELTSTQKSCESPPQRDEGRTSEDVIREWVARFATNCGQTLSEARVLLWLDDLGDIEPQRLESAFRAVMRTHTFNSIPQIGEIWQQIDQADTCCLQLEMEDAWRRALQYARRHYHPDIPSRLERAPQLPPLIEYAMRCVNGGIHALWGSSDDELVWRKKEFVAAYENRRQLDDCTHLLSNGKARRILAHLSAQELSTPKVLSPAPTARSLSEDDSVQPDPEGQRALDEMYMTLKPPVFQPKTIQLVKANELPKAYVPCVAEIDRRKEEQKMAFEAYCNAHPNVCRKGKPLSFVQSEDQKRKEQEEIRKALARGAEL